MPVRLRIILRIWVVTTLVERLTCGAVLVIILQQWWQHSDGFRRRWRDFFYTLTFFFLVGVLISNTAKTLRKRSLTNGVVLLHKLFDFTWNFIEKIFHNENIFLTVNIFFFTRFLNKSLPIFFFLVVEIFKSL